MKGSEKGKEALYSFQSVSAFPYKILAHAGELRERFFPIHASFNLTNRCQRNCAYCASRDRGDRDRELDFGKYLQILNWLTGEGLRAITLTGAGEPTLYSRFKTAVASAAELRKVKVGMVTNGIALECMDEGALGMLSWVRVSMDRTRKLPRIPKVLKDRVAYSFVYDTETQPDDAVLSSLFSLLERGECTHLRIVADIYNADQIEIPPWFREKEGVVVQDRIRAEKGTKAPCWTAITHPKIDVDGIFYPCCGTQYVAENQAERTCMRDLAIGDLAYYMALCDSQEPFTNTNLCDRCYYVPHNDLLEKIRISRELKHVEFV